MDSVFRPVSIIIYFITAFPPMQERGTKKRAFAALFETGFFRYGSAGTYSPNVTRTVMRSPSRRIRKSAESPAL